MNESVRKILVVDDQENWRKVLENLLKQENYQVQTAANFEEARKAISHTNFALLVLDVRLVDEEVFNVQGLELLQYAESREFSPSVIVLTGYPKSIKSGVLERYDTCILMSKVPGGGRFDINVFLDKVQELTS